MRSVARVLAGLALGLLAGQAEASPPQRVMSLSLCTDQLLLDLLPPERITSVTYLSRDHRQSYLSTAAWQVGVNHGNAEEVVQQRPDLVLAGTFTSPDTRRLLKSVGIPVLELPPANSFDDIRVQTRALGQALGVETRAESLLQQMDHTLSALAATTAPSITVVGWDGSGGVPGRGTLFDAIISAAGAVNLGAQPGLDSTRFDTEQLLMTRPDLLAYGDSDAADPALHNSPLRHPLVQNLYQGRQLIYPELLYSCGLPQSAQAAAQLRQVMRAALNGKPPA